MWKAGNGTRTRDPNLGKVVLYQLSYSRTVTRLTRKAMLVITDRITSPEADQSRESRTQITDFGTHRGNLPSPASARLLMTTHFTHPSRHGGEGNRTPDLLNAIQALSQLSYAPVSESKSPTCWKRWRCWKCWSHNRLPTGTPKYSPGYRECQRKRTGENLSGRYLAAPFANSVARFQLVSAFVSGVRVL